MPKRISVGDRLAEDIIVAQKYDSEGQRGGIESVFRFFGINSLEMIDQGQGCLLIVISSLGYEEARRIARELVIRKMALRADIVPKVSSILWSEDEVDEMEDSFVLVLTREELFPNVVEVVKQIQGVDIPKMIALPVLSDNSAYAGDDKGVYEIEITLGEITTRAWLDTSDTAHKILEAAPITSIINIWGKEIYFSVPLKKDLENGTDTVCFGDIAYWPPAKAVCIYLGETPISHYGRIKPLTPVEVIGRVENPELLLKRAQQGQIICMKKH